MVQTLAANYFIPTTFLPEHVAPETRLWCAVIAQPIADCHQPIRSALNLSKMLGVAPNALRHDFEEVISNVTHPWFSVVCSFVDFHPRHVLNALYKIREESGFLKIKFVDDETYMRLAMKKIKENPRLAMQLLAPVHRYAGYCKKQKIRQGKRGGGTGPLSLSPRRGRPRSGLRKIS